MMNLDGKTIAVAVLSLAGAGTGVNGALTANDVERQTEARLVALETARTYEGEDLKEIKDNQKKILDTLNDLKRDRR
jgi:hypothetical protein